jgi:hypothetical protein
MFPGEHPIELSGDGLMRQASMTADEYLWRAIEDIDKRLGKGYAKAHPELIAAYMQAASTDCAGAIIAQQVRAGLDRIAEQIQAASEQLDVGRRT